MVYMHDSFSEWINYKIAENAAIFLSGKYKNKFLIDILILSKNNRFWL